MSKKPISFSEYETIDAERWSHLRWMAVSPLHYKWHCESQISDGRPLRVGRALHTLILEPESFGARHPLFTGKVRRGKAWDEFEAEHIGSDPLIASEMEAVQRMAESVTQSQRAREHLADSLSEKTLVWVDEETGIRCKGRCDSVNGHLVELKTCNGGAFPPERFEQHAARYRYHGQCAFYADGLVATGYEVDHGPAMIVVESEPPYDCAVYELKEEFMAAGKALYQKLLKRVKECRQTGEYPGVTDGGELHLGLPEWAEWETLEPAEPITIGGVAIGGI